MIDPGPVRRRRDRRAWPPGTPGKTHQERASGVLVDVAGKSLAARRLTCEVGGRLLFLSSPPMQSESGRVVSDLQKLQTDLARVLKYTQEVLAFRETVVMNVQKERQVVAFEHETARLEGVEASPEPEIWLRLRRLRETKPPSPDEMFAGWVQKGTGQSPIKPPVLSDHRMIRVSAEHASDLIEAGLVDADEALRPVDVVEDHPSEVDVILRTSRMPEFVATFSDYVEGPWRKWAEVERPRRVAIEIYNRLFTIQQRVTAAGEDNNVEVIWGLGMARWSTDGSIINVPLLEQSMDIELSPDGTIDVVPRQSAPQLTLKPFLHLQLPGAPKLQKDVQADLEAIHKDPDRGFSPFDRTLRERLLKPCAARLSPTGLFVPDDEGRDPADRGLPAIDGELRITDTWVIYVRPRSMDARTEDVARLIGQIEDVDRPEKLPAAGVRFVVPPSDRPSSVEVVDLDADGMGSQIGSGEFHLPESGGGGTGWSGASGEPSTIRAHDSYQLFFPLPHNEAQRQIALRLRDEDGVVVQGPPGTGKTHTIANIICHYLARGKRVLVTAKTAEALSALRERLPPGIRDVCISVIHTDREGAQRLEEAVRILADEAKIIDLGQAKREASALEQRIARTRSEISEIDQALVAEARKNLEAVEVTSGSALQKLSPSELARRVALHRERHTWFTDVLGLSARFEPAFDSSTIADAAQIRRRLGSDLTLDAARLPDPAALPDVAAVVKAHAELARDDALAALTSSGSIPFMASGALDRAARLRKSLQEFAAFFAEAAKEAWMFDCFRRLAGVSEARVSNSDPLIFDALQKALDHWADLYSEGRGFLIRAIEIGDVDLGDASFETALRSLATGRKPFGLLPFGKGKLKAAIEAVRINGGPPRSPSDWAEVVAFLSWQREATAFLRRWNSSAAVLGVPSLPAGWTEGRSALTRLGPTVATLTRFIDEATGIREDIEAVFPAGIDAVAVLHEGETKLALHALDAHLGRADLAGARMLRDALLASASRGEEGAQTAFEAAIGEFATGLGDPSADPATVGAAWQAILDEAFRLAALRPDIERLDEISAIIDACGAPQWGQALRWNVIPSTATDPWTPPTWKETWDWARIASYVSTLGDRRRLEDLVAERRRLDDQERATMAELVRLRTLVGMKQKLTDRIETALVKFTSAVVRLGTGAKTNKATGRHRRVIRDAAMDAASAVPCWILPEWRVSEQLPPELAAFDLVIVDEASQSEITALPAILRGKKLLVVGDDRQVSPTPVGLEEKTIIQLRTTFLTGLPFADQMEPSTSLYELSQMLFPGRAVMLTEHFRCVEPIIRFSNRFYVRPDGSGGLVPMRVPTAKDRLEPPLVDIWVKGGLKTGHVNEREAQAIVEEIITMVRDPAFESRTIGVISLIGDKQAQFIGDRLIEELGSELIEKHRIMCGNAATFQGQERDVILLSMVASPGDARSMVQRLYAQRFNVALSRARDRMILVRSVTSSDLKPGDLKLAVVEHFRDPMAGRPLLLGRDVLDACGSGFEREFGSRLLDMGYRLRAQVPAAGFRIDFVIEGADDRRLAVELDGDQWHGPDRWAADFQRQVILERLGWVFWRCWGSSWGADPDACIEDLRQRLDSMGIKPIGASSMLAVWTEHKVIETDASPEELSASLSVDSAAADNAGGATRVVSETVQNFAKGAIAR